MKKLIFSLFIICAGYLSVNAQCNVYSVDLDGVNACVLVPENLFPNPTTVYRFTIEFYLKKEDSTMTHAHVFSKQGSWKEVEAGIDSNKFSMGYINPAQNQPVSFSVWPTVNIGAWDHYAVCFDSTVERVFQNGIEIGNGPVTFPSNWETTGASWNINGYTTVIGKHPMFGALNGKIDEFRISSVARYDTNFIPPLYLVSDSVTQLLYKFDENMGDTVYDYSGNAKNGILYGGAIRSADVPYGAGFSIQQNYSGSESICSGDSLLISINSSVNVIYQWYSDSILLSGQNTSTYLAYQSGNYYCIVSDSSSSCQLISDTVFFKINSLPAKPVVNGILFIPEVPDTSIYWIQLQSGNAIVWDVVNGNIIAGQSTDTIVVEWTTAGFGTVSATIYDSNTCSNDSTLLVYVSAVNISKNIQNKHGLSIYPNPAHDEIYLEGGEIAEITGINIYDLSGRLVNTTNYRQKDKIIINISSLENGVYSLSVENKFNEQIVFSLFIKN